MRIIGELVNDRFDSTRTYELVDYNMFVSVIKRDDEQFIRGNQGMLSLGALYILVGKQPVHTKRKIYIGETHNVYQRIRQHIDRKDFWEYVIVFTRNSTEQLNKSQVQYLEHLAIKEAIECGSVELLENCNIPREPYLNESDKEEMNKFFYYVKEMQAYAGFDIFNDFKVCDISESLSGKHNVMSRIIKEYSSKSVYRTKEDSTSCMVAEDYNDYGYGNCYDEEEQSVSYSMNPYTREYKADAIMMNDGKIMIMPFGYISNKVKFSDIEHLVDIDRCIDRKTRSIKKDIILDNLDDAALVIVGRRDKRLWTKKVYSF